MTIIVNIIGAGNLGKTLGHLFVRSGLVQIGEICNTTVMSSKAAIEFIGEGKYCDEIAQLSPADLTLITTQDALISEICQKLSQSKHIKKGSMILHCSGSLTSEALISAKQVGCLTASIHPMRSFAKPALSIEAYPGTYCAMEGDAEAIEKLGHLFRAIGSITFSINPDKKTLYHAAGVFASNYLITLSKQALACLDEAGVEDKMALEMIINLMRGALSNLEQTLSPVQSLTGPIQRGEVELMHQHLAAFTSKEHKELYTTLGHATLSLTSHDATTMKKIEAALAGNGLPPKQG